MQVITHLKDALQGKHPLDTARSGHWTAVRKHHLEQHPACAVCGGTAKIEVHHKRPFHLHPDLELDPNNLITLCEAGGNGINCHLAIGHSGSFKSFNVDVEKDSAYLLDKITNRP